MKFNGSSWESFGAAGFSATGYAYDISLAIDATNTPYVAFENATSGEKATVMNGQ